MVAMTSITFGEEREHQVTIYTTTVSVTRRPSQVPFSHMINSPRLSPFLRFFVCAWGEPGTEARFLHMFTTATKKEIVID